MDAFYWWVGLVVVLALAIAISVAVVWSCVWVASQLVRRIYNRLWEVTCGVYWLVAFGMWRRGRMRDAIRLLKHAYERDKLNISNESLCCRFCGVDIMADIVAEKSED